MKIIHAIDKTILFALRLLCTTLALSMALVVFLQILMRLFATPLLWSEEIARIMMVWLVFMGAAYLHNMTTNGHITVDVLHQILPPKITRVLKIVIQILIFVILLITSVYGFQLAASSFHIKSTALRVPFTFIYGAIPVSATIMIWFSLRSWIDKSGGKSE